MIHILFHLEWIQNAALYDLVLMNIRFNETNKFWYLHTLNIHFQFVGEGYLAVFPKSRTVAHSREIRPTLEGVISRLPLFTDSR